jgi:hypothetical protein
LERLVGLSSDGEFVRSILVTLVADTNKEVTIPTGTIGIHVNHGLAAPVYFNRGAAVTIPTDETVRNCGFIAPNTDTSRILDADPLPAGIKLHLRSAAAGSFTVEFWG